LAIVTRPFDIEGESFLPICDGLVDINALSVEPVKVGGVHVESTYS
jgi:hypothetical protein